MVKLMPHDFMFFDDIGNPVFEFDQLHPAGVGGGLDVIEHAAGFAQDDETRADLERLMDVVGDQQTGPLRLAHQIQKDLPQTSGRGLIQVSELRIQSVVTAASMALPPLASISIPAVEPRGWLHATTPRVPSTDVFRCQTACWL